MTTPKSDYRGQRLERLEPPAFLEQARHLGSAYGTAHQQDAVNLTRKLVGVRQGVGGAQPARRAAKFPVVKSLETFDYLAIPSLNKKLVLELARCD